MSQGGRKSIFDTQPDFAEQERLDAVAEAEIDAGLGVRHELVLECLAKLANGEDSPPPTA